MQRVDSLYKHTSGTRTSCCAYIERQKKSIIVLLTELTCLENKALGPKDLVLML